MSVICESISVIVRVDVLDLRHHGGAEGCRRAAPSPTYCSDGVLARVGFSSLDEAGWWIRVLRAKGLQQPRGGRAVDVVVVDEERGVLMPCDWIETAVTGGVRRAWAVGGPEGALAVPAGWVSARS